MDLKKEKSRLEKLKIKYRLVIMNDESLEERLSMRLSKMNVYVVASTLFVVTVLATTAFIILTPLKEYIPGYGDVGMQERAVALTYTADSLEEKLQQQTQYIQTIKDIITGEVGKVVEEADTNAETPDREYGQLVLDHHSPEDSLLRAEVENLDNYALVENQGSGRIGLRDLYFFSPVSDGIVSDQFDPDRNHLGVDLTSPTESAPIKSILDGVVVLDTWSLETGYVIGIQHRNNLLSFYKHNSVLMKKTGNFVRAGDVIAVMGNSGEQTTGPHLHFELWYNQSPINPTEYINLN